MSDLESGEESVYKSSLISTLGFLAHNTSSAKKGATTD